MHHPFLVGEHLYLRRLEEDDLNETYLGWLNDAQVTRYLETGKFPSTMESLRAFWERFEHSSTDLLFAIVTVADDQHIGNVTLNHISWIHRTADTGLLIGEKDGWGHGYAFEAWSLLIDYAFRRLGLRKIIAGAIVDNAASVVTLKKLGFKIEGTFRQEYLVDGEYRDGVRLGLLREEFYKYVQSPDSESLKQNKGANQVS